MQPGGLLLCEWTADMMTASPIDTQERDLDRRSKVSPSQAVGSSQADLSE